MSRRERIDPETARVVEQRLEWLLREHGPDPTRPDPTRPDPTRSNPTRPNPTRPDPTGSEPTRPEPITRPRRGRPDAPEVDDEPATDDIGSGSGPVEGHRPAERNLRAPRTALLTSVTSFRRPHLVIVAAILALGILVAGWALLRARPVAVAVTPPPITTSATAEATSATTAATSATTAGPSPTAGIVVHVLGAVHEPGLVSLTAGSRVQDALEAAGGLTDKADPGELNLAQPVADGQQIVVGTKKKPTGEVRDGTGGPGSAGSGAAASPKGQDGASGQAVDLNTASQAELEELPGVGPVMAGKIIAWRTEHGRFSRVEELQEIDGVGPKTYAKLSPLCRV
jgi:competence protein ComEA